MGMPRLRATALVGGGALNPYGAYAGRRRASIPHGATASHDAHHSSRRLLKICPQLPPKLHSRYEGLGSRVRSREPTSSHLIIVPAPSSSPLPALCGRPDLALGLPAIGCQGRHRGQHAQQSAKGPPSLLCLHSSNTLQCSSAIPSIWVCMPQACASSLPSPTNTDTHHRSQKGPSVRSTFPHVTTYLPTYPNGLCPSLRLPHPHPPHSHHTQGRTARAPPMHRRRDDRHQQKPGIHSIPTAYHPIHASSPAHIPSPMLTLSPTLAAARRCAPCRQRHPAAPAAGHAGCYWRACTVKHSKAQHGTRQAQRQSTQGGGACSVSGQDRQPVPPFS